MRETFSTLIQASKDLITDSSTVSSDANISDTETFIKKEINRIYRDLQSRLNNHLTQVSATTTTVAQQQYYYLPPDCHTIEAMTVVYGGRTWPLQPVQIDRWLDVNRIIFQATTVPNYYFRREKDFGIWPIPQASGNTITLWYNRVFKDMTALDYNTGTVTVTNGSTTITGVATVWTSAMIGRYFNSVDGQWYRISDVTSPTVAVLETVYAGTTTSGASYVIGESPEIPPEMHAYIPYAVAAHYYGGPRRDPDTAQKMSNYYYTGSFNNSLVDPQAERSGVNYWINYYNGKGRDTTGITDKSSINVVYFTDQFSTVTEQ